MKGIRSAAGELTLGAAFDKRAKNVVDFVYAAVASSSPNGSVTSMICTVIGTRDQDMITFLSILYCLILELVWPWRREPPLSMSLPLEELPGAVLHPYWVSKATVASSTKTCSLGYGVCI